MSTMNRATTLDNHDNLFPGETESLINLESDYPTPTLEQIEALSTELESIYGPNLSPDFPVSAPSFDPRTCDIPPPVLEYADLSQAQINEFDTDNRQADINQPRDLLAQPRYCYPDPSQSVHQTPVNPYFTNAAPLSRAQHQQCQKPLPSVNFYPDPSQKVHRTPVNPYFNNAAPRSGAQYQQRQKHLPSVPDPTQSAYQTPVNPYFINATPRSRAQYQQRQKPLPSVPDPSQSAYQKPVNPAAAPFSGAQYQQRQKPLPSAPDPSQSVHQTPVNPYFMNAAPRSGAQYQQRQKPLPSIPDPTQSAYQTPVNPYYINAAPLSGAQYQQRQKPLPSVPDPTQSAYQTPVNPYFINAAPRSRAQYQQRQKPIPSVPDSTQSAYQTPVNPYFINAAPLSGAQNQQRQEPLPLVNLHPENSASFNQSNPPQTILEPSQDPQHGSPQLIEHGFDEQTPYEMSQIDPPVQYQGSVKPQNLAQPQLIRPGDSIGQPFDTSESRSPSLKSVGIDCKEYPPLDNAPVCWSGFEYNQHGELKPGNVYSVEEIEWYLFRNPKHLTPFGYFPKLGGLTLWIQRAPDPEEHCHNDPSVLRCRLKCCKQSGIISTGELRVAFDEQTRMFPNHNPQHNAGYVHLRCLERFLDFPRICVELVVKAEERVLDSRKPIRNCMMLQTIEEVDVVDRFINFCSANRRAPASYPIMNMRTRTRPFQDTLMHEINITGQLPYVDFLQRVWETQGRSGVLAECERVTKVKLKKRRRRAMAALQVDELGIGAQYTVKKALQKGRKRAGKFEPEPEHESELDSEQGFNRRGRKRARISKIKPNSERAQRKKGKNKYRHGKQRLSHLQNQRRLNEELETRPAMTSLRPGSKWP